MEITGQHFINLGGVAVFSTFFHKRRENWQLMDVKYFGITVMMMLIGVLQGFVMEFSTE